MTIDDALTLAPAIGATTPAAHLSGRYRQIPTLPIVEALVENGWEITSARQNRTDDPFAMHRVDFSLPGTDALARRFPGEMRLAAHIFNSSNGSRRLSFCCGVYVCVCSNQAHAPMRRENIDRVHVGRGGFDIRRMIGETINEGNALVTQVERMRSTHLDATRRVEFARAALAQSRGFIDASFVVPGDALPLLHPMRESQVNAADVWTTFNVVQERLIERGKRGGVHEILRNDHLNKFLWAQAVALTRN